MKKKILIAVLAISAACSSFAFTACNDEKKPDNENNKPISSEPERVSGNDGLEYTLSDDGTFYYLSGLGICTDTEIVVANYYNEKPVKQIGKYVYTTYDEIEDSEYGDLEEEERLPLCIFLGSEVKSVTVPEGITAIGAFAFSGFFLDDGTYDDINFNKIESVSLPKSLTFIGYYSFYLCTNLKNVNIPNGVTSIGDDAFAGCFGLENITIPDSVTRVGEEAFYSCSAIKSLKLGSGVTEINKSAFQYCSSLTSVTIPNGVTLIGYNSFSDCSGLTGVIIPDSVTSIDNFAFWGCDKLTSITYNGTKARWEAVTKGESWLGDLYEGIDYFTIHCSDGDIEI